MAEAAAELGARHVPNVEKSEAGVPLFSFAVLEGQRLASNDVVAYVNSDIILFDDFPNAIASVRKKSWSKWLLVGQRRTVELEGSLDFANPQDVSAFRQRASACAPDSPTAKDYFVFPKGMYPKVPAFVVGRDAYDNWMVGDAVMRGIPVVDCTPCVVAAHQQHDYNHVISKEERVNLPDSRRGYALAGQLANMFGHTDCSTWVLRGGRLRRRFVLKNTVLNAARLLVRRNPLYWRYEMARLKGMFFPAGAGSHD
ncbi:MAG: hypothetical protein LBR38_02475 [Synergistaceae bacterium]|nr:hypothetical protein [Synergistaceae bacterium]